MKRNNYISWDEYFMGVSLLAAERSKDPSTQVGACIINEDKKIISTGYNGAPIGYDDDLDMTWEREGDFLKTKYAYVCHAELNAILNAPHSVKGGTIYVALFPCNECAKAIIQAGIKEIVYMNDKYADTEGVIASKKMLDACGVIYRQYEKKDRVLNLNL